VQGPPRLSQADQRALASIENEDLKKVIGELLESTRLNQRNFEEIERWFPVQPKDSVARRYEGGGVTGIPFEKAVAGLVSSGGAWTRGGKGAVVERTGKGVYRITYGFEADSVTVYPQIEGVSADWSVLGEEGPGEDVIVVQTYVAKTGEKIDTEFFFSAFVLGEAGTLLVGPEGPAGPTHKTLYHGEGAPSAELGAVDDFYIDTKNWTIYGPKTEEGWGEATSLVGPAGAPGEPGAPGEKGATGERGEAGAGAIAARLATAKALNENTRAGNILEANAVGKLNVDGVSASKGDVILVKNEATGANNGAYVVINVGTVLTEKWKLERDPRMDTSAECVSGMQITVSEGSASNGRDTTWMLITNAPIVLNETALVFELARTQPAPSSVLAVSLGSLGLEKEFANGSYGSNTKSVAPGEKKAFFVPILVPHRLSTAFSFVRYIVGATSNGEVWVRLYFEGKQVSGTVKKAQEAAGTAQQVLVGPGTNVEPGIWHVGIALTSATGTWQGFEKYLQRYRKQALGAATELPAEIPAEPEALNTEGVPFVCLA
jgi:hypothetical protein